MENEDHAIYRAELWNNPKHLTNLQNASPAVAGRSTPLYPFVICRYISSTSVLGLHNHYHRAFRNTPYDTDI